MKWSTLKMKCFILSVPCQSSRVPRVDSQPLRHHLVLVHWQLVILINRLSGRNLNNPGVTSVCVWLFTLLPTSNSNTSHYYRPSVATGQCWLTALKTSHSSPPPQGSGWTSSTNVGIGKYIACQFRLCLIFKKFMVIITCQHKKCDYVVR